MFASGSPQEAVEYGGKFVHASQANNMYVFPGLALGAYLGGMGTVSDGMVCTLALTLSLTLALTPILTLQ